MRSHRSVVVAAFGAALAFALPVAFAGSSADPGISPTTIVIGGTSPLTGPAASYASVARGAKAYFEFVNAGGGVAKRKIDYRIVDDAYNPAQTVQAVRGSSSRTRCSPSSTHSARRRTSRSATT